MSSAGRLCFVAYRGNMQCGGQGIYLWFLTRELAKLGFEIDVVVGPPYPDEMPFARSVSTVASSAQTRASRSRMTRSSANRRAGRRR